MDGDRFDQLAKSLIRATPRRAVFKLFAGGAFGAALARLGIEGAGAACVAAGKACARGDTCCAGSTCRQGRCTCKAGLKDCGKVCQACCTGDDCAAGQACVGGRCACTAASCPDGCCKGVVCKNGDTTGACGTGGQRCKRCPAPTGGTAFCLENGTCGQTCPNAEPCVCRDRCIDIRVDGFPGDEVDPCKFSVAPINRDNVVVSNGRLEMSPDEAGGGGIAQYRCRLDGDYEVEVEFDLLGFPDQSLAFLITFDPGVSRDGTISRTRRGGRDYYEFSSSGTPLTQVPATETSGALRLKRTGTFVEGSYRTSAGAWVAVGAATIAEAKPVEVTLNAINNARPTDLTMKVAFDNYKVGEQTAVVCDGGVACPA